MLFLPPLTTLSVQQMILLPPNRSTPPSNPNGCRCLCPIDTTSHTQRMPPPPPNQFAPPPKPNKYQCLWLRLIDSTSHTQQTQFKAPPVPRTAATPAATTLKTRFRGHPTTTSFN
mmetsp:Transcript_4339/g.7154  ORF Transcript_4339/g.7154 Transcript_4339/m.7154 type:complete len:115 (-) Transcript_4339:80-424(-)